MSDFKKQYLPAAVAAAQKYGIDPVMFAAQIEQESGWNPAAKSSAGARGLGQFMPATARQVGVNPLDPLASLDASAKYMRKLVDKFGSEDVARQAYNAGETKVARVLAGKDKFKPETVNYNPLIAKRAAKLQTEVAALGGSATASRQNTIPADAVAPAPMRAAGEPGGRQVSSNADAAQVALAEMAAGMPTPQIQAPASEPDWRNALQALGGPQPVAASAPMDLDIFGQELEDMAAQSQDATLAQMFGDVLPAQRENTSILPSSVDRYLDKILA